MRAEQAAEEPPMLYSLPVRENGVEHGNEDYEENPV